MQVDICGKKYDIDDGLSDTEVDLAIKALVEKVVEEIPQEVLDQICQAAIEEVAAAKKIKEAREERMNSGSFTVIDAAGMKSLQETMKLDEEYAKEKAEKAKQ